MNMINLENIDPGANEMNVGEAHAAHDTIYDFNQEDNRELMRAKPWDRDKDYFKYCHISSVALMKMVLHTERGGKMEVMGLMIGKVVDKSLVVMDAFELPVEGTETRVNAHEQAYEYMARYVEEYRYSRPEQVIGWYHSHPGYGCWLSGIDVNTQRHHQEFQDPFVAIVIDPKKTFSSGTVDIGAFRTYPRGNVNSQQATSSTSVSASKRSSKTDQALSTPVKSSTSDNDDDLAALLPSNKVKDFGVHRDDYYPLKVSFFKTKFDGALLEAMSKNLSQTALFSYDKILENSICASHKILNQVIKTRQVQKSWKNWNVGSFQKSSRMDDMFTDKSAGPTSLRDVASQQQCVNDPKSKMDFEYVRMDQISQGLMKLRKTACLISTDMLASYLPLQAKQELATRKDSTMQISEAGSDTGENVQKEYSSEAARVIDKIVNSYDFIDPHATKS